jgi:hypothetical protein
MRNASTASALRDKTKCLYQPWRNDAFMADEYVQVMTPIQRWMYRTLLQAAFTCRERPYLPDDDARLWVLAGCENQQQWEINKVMIRACFTPKVIDGIPLLGHKATLDDWERMQNALAVRRESASVAGKASAAKRWGAAKSDGGVAEADFEPQDTNEQSTDANAEPTSDNGTLTERQRKITNRTEQNVTKPTNLPTKTAAGGSVGLVAVDSRAPLVPSNSAGNKKSDDEQTPESSGWRADLQRTILQCAGTEANDGDGVVLSVPFPESVFAWVEQTAREYRTKPARIFPAVEKWLAQRSFSGLNNPNIVWMKMEDEIPGFLLAVVREIRSGARS